MKLTWHGHACFRVQSDSGSIIVTDPYDPEASGYRPVTDSADVVVRSSPSDRFHNNAEMIPGVPLLIEALELARSGVVRMVGGVPFHAVEAREAADHPDHPPEANAMYRFEVDGIHIGHMGDVGNPLDEEQLRFFEGIDVLLALTGGPPTIALDDLARAIEQLTPRLVVPMHFRTLRAKLTGMRWLPDFLAYFDDDQIDFAFSETVELNRGDLPEATRVLVLDHV